MPSRSVEVVAREYFVMRGWLGFLKVMILDTELAR